MKIELHQIPVREITENFIDNNYEGVSTIWTGKEIGNITKPHILNIRPPYQREFIYSDEKQKLVLNTVRHGFPLNVMYWVKNDDGSYEVLDGQQRIMSILKFIKGNGKTAGSFTTFKFEDFVEADEIGFDSLSENKQEQILSYPLQVYICEGSTDEKLRWFEIINVAGEVLKEQELLNAMHTGIWLTDAKSFFSRVGQGADNYTKGKNALIKGEADRQDLLRIALKWICNKKDYKSIGDYMSRNDKKENADELKNYFKDVMCWVQDTFNTHENYRKEMKGKDWGILYNQYYKKTKNWDSKLVEKEIQKLMKDSDVTNKSGIYDYILAGEFINDKFVPNNNFENKLSIRIFDENMKREAYEKQNHICPKCLKEYPIEKMQADHITPWCKGGKTIANNLQMLCEECNRKKSGK